MYTAGADAFCVSDYFAALFSDDRRQSHVAQRGNLRSARDRPETLSNERLCFVEIDVAGDDEHGVVRRVVGVEEILDVVDGSVVRSVIEPITECWYG